ncbi:hypothetical protein SUGI_0531580 [Cryptomeria japonica]|nr:hypothetical protein SUGI_0531580 [Cryptomeria japonica]
MYAYLEIGQLSKKNIILKRLNFYDMHNPNIHSLIVKKIESEHYAKLGVDPSKLEGGLDVSRDTVSEATVSSEREKPKGQSNEIAPPEQDETIKALGPKKGGKKNPQGNNELSPDARRAPNPKRATDQRKKTKPIANSKEGHQNKRRKNPKMAHPKPKRRKRGMKPTMSSTKQQVSSSSGCHKQILETPVRSYSLPPSSNCHAQTR